MFGRRAFSRGELLVALALVSVLGALVVSLLARARESAARTSCQNNLKQLTLGVMNYHDVNLQLPPLADSDAGLVSVFATICPYLTSYCWHYAPGRSQADAYHAPSSVVFPCRGKDGAELSQEGGDANQIWRAFLDPADPTPNGLRDIAVTLPDGTTGHHATGNYAANGLLPWGQKLGAKSLGEWPTLAILFAERPQVCRTADGETVHNLWGVGFYSPSMPTFATLTPTNPPGLWSTGQVSPAGGGMVRVGRADADPQPANFPAPFQVLRGEQPCDPRLPGTPHRAGMQTAMSDGSVRLFAPSTEPWVFWAACAAPSHQ
ncbi:MAG TPA: DUF1559 domain-containing protein [Gemmata sp.]